ncbi:MAG: carboxypeptidase-like regulatory domain-containing protein [Planctomycetes bacterium]|nr:carboxypeptidase-like regulatory domain-containing protein [Planctomycetota bacterium]
MTRDETGAPIAEAALWVAVETGVRRLGSTNEFGRFALAAVDVEGRQLWANAAGYETRSLWVATNACAVGTLELVLPRAAELVGTVWHRGAPRADARIVAWPAGVGPSCELLRSASEDDPRLLQARSGADGRFVIEGVARGREYHVVAAVDGLVTRRTVRGVRPEELLELELVALYGARIVVVERGGSNVRTAAAWADASAEEWLDLDELAELVDGDEVVCLLDLAGVPAAETRFDYAYLCTRGDGAPSAGPVMVSYRLPNYFAVTRRVDLPRAIDALEERRIELEPRGEPVGALQVEFRGALAELSLGKAPCNYLELVDDRDAKHRLYLEHTSGTARIDGLPCGRYDVRFVAADGLGDGSTTMSLREVRIDATAQLVTIDWNDAGALRVTVPPTADAQSGTLWLRADGRRGLHRFDFFERTARIVGLSPGEYHLMLCRPGDPQRPDLAPFEARATVRSREEVTVELAAR